MLAELRMEAILAELDMDVKRGLHTPEKQRIARYAAAHARETWVLADSSKFGAVAAASVLPLNGARIVTDRLDDRRYSEYPDIKEV
ncbi:MAG: hypothetical protein K2M42_11475 [Oscillospiraceae bacterium]|nr:hypothetical protein [Oscillospiraceae bacterium]